MTADIATQTKSNTSGTQMPTLALAFAILTLILAALSLFFGTRLVALQDKHNHTQQEAAQSEATAVEEMQALIKTTRQALEAEKATTVKLRTQIAAANKALKKTKAELASAKQTIESLKPTPTEMPSSSPEATPSSAAPATQGPTDETSVTSSVPTQAPVTRTDTAEQQTVSAPLPDANSGVETPPTTTPSVSSGEKSDSGSLSEESIGVTKSQVNADTSDSGTVQTD